MVVFWCIVALIAAGPIIAYFFNKEQKDINNRLIGFIAQNYASLARGENLDFDGTLVNFETKLTRYRYCYSFVIMTNSGSSAFFIAENAGVNSEAKKAKAICQLITALAGWWGIPWGIIYSIRNISTNAFKNGACDETIGSVMQKLSQK